MKSLNQTAVGLKPSGIRKFFDIVSEMPDAISLGVGEPDFETPWHISEEGIYSLEKGRTFYTSNSGLKDLRNAISRMVRRNYNLSYQGDTECLITVGGSEGIDLALRALCNPGDEVIIPEPCYVSYKPCAELIGAKPVIIDLQEKNRFKLTEEELRQAVTDQTKILILTYPNNPTGAIMTREELEPIAKVCVEKDLYVISDEIYAALTYGKEPHCSIASLPGMKERTIVVNGFSKAYAMTGWRLGYVLAPEKICKLMTKIHQFTIMCAPTTSQYAAIEAVNNGDGDIERMRTSYNERRRYLVRKLAEIGMPAFEPEGAFYIFPSIRKFGMSSDDFATELLKKEKLAVVPGTAFGNSGEGYVRISYAYSMERLQEAMGRIEHFLKERQASR